SKTIGGILEHAGYASPFSVTAKEFDKGLSGLEALVRSYFLADGSGRTVDSTSTGVSVTPSDLLERAREIGSFDWLTPELDEKEIRSERKKFASQCARFDRRFFTVRDDHGSETKVLFQSLGTGHQKRYQMALAPAS